MFLQHQTLNRNPEQLFDTTTPTIQCIYLNKKPLTMTMKILAMMREALLPLSVTIRSLATDTALRIHQEQRYAR